MPRSAAQPLPGLLLNCLFLVALGSRLLREPLAGLPVAAALAGLWGLGWMVCWLGMRHGARAGAAGGTGPPRPG